ncbi:MAG: N-acetylmuramoyl-L-alanine amidase [Candidatus Gastranaerophilaceae bacterium]
MVTSRVTGVQSGNSKSAQVKRQTEITVKSGETLTQIAKRYNMTPNEFMAWTGLKKSALNAGQKIALPNDTIPAGKGILALARKYGMTLDEFCKLNNISKTYSPAKGEAFYVINHNKANASSGAKTQPAAPKVTPATQKPQAKPKTTETKPKAKPKADTTNTKVTARTATAKVTTVAENKAKWGSSYTPQELADKIYEGSKKFAAVGKPDFDALIDEINPKNVEEVLKAYTKKESLINTIVSEVGSNKDVRKKAVMHVFDALSKKKNIPAAVRANFEKELNNRFSSIGMVSTKRLDKTITRMMQTPEQLAKEMAAYVGNHVAAVGDYDYQEMLSLVGSHNVSQVVTAYNKISPKESLINAITSEIGSSQKERKAAVMHIYDAIAKQKGASPNLRNQFKAELDAQFDKTFGMVDTEKLDKMINDLVKKSTATASETKISNSKKSELPQAKTLAEQKRNSVLSAARKDIENRFYNAIIDKRTGVKYPSFREQLVQQIENNPNLSEAEKKTQIAKARKATVDVSTISRPVPQLDEKGNIKHTVEIEELKPTGKSNNKVVIINEGHGGYNSSAYDAGAFSYYEKPKGSNKYYPFEEYKVVKPYSKDLTEKLRSQGYTVVRVTGAVESMSNQKTIEKLNDKYSKKFGVNNAMFVSLHCDAGSATVTGSDVCYDPFDNKDKKLADMMNTSLNKQNWIKSKTTPRYNKKKTDCGLYVLKKCKNIPSVLLEIEYLTGTRSLNVTSSDYRNQFVTATYDAIEQYFSTNRG